MDSHVWFEGEGCSFEGTKQGNLQTPVGIISLNNNGWNMITAHIPEDYDVR